MTRDGERTELRNTIITEAVGSIEDQLRQYMSSVTQFRRPGDVATALAAPGQIEDPDLYESTNQRLFNQLNEAHPLPHRLPQHLAAISSDSSEEEEKGDDPFEINTDHAEEEEEEPSAPLIVPSQPERTRPPAPSVRPSPLPVAEETEPRRRSTQSSVSSRVEHKPPPLPSQEEEEGYEFLSDDSASPPPRKVDSRQSVDLFRKPDEGRPKPAKLHPTFAPSAADASDEFVFNGTTPAPEGSDSDSEPLFSKDRLADGYGPAESSDGPELLNPRHDSFVFNDDD
jgi:hypothetical protein